VKTSEARAIEQFRTRDLPEIKHTLDSAAGFKVPLHVDWETLAVENFAHMYGECFQQVYFAPLIGAFRSICQDEPGKAALQGSLRKVVLCNTLDVSNPSGFTFVAGVLTLDHKPHYNIDNVREREAHLIQMLERAL
jgi:hypothetical protein